MHAPSPSATLRCSDLRSPDLRSPHLRSPHLRSAHLRSPDLRKLAGAIALLVSLVVVPRPAAAQAAIDPEIERLGGELSKAAPHEAYDVLRQIWQRWEEADPDHVENALSAARGDAKLAPAVRAYAGVLEAYARRRRGDLAGATREIEKLGFIRDWLIVGPFANDNRAGLAETHLVEQELDQPIVLDRSFPAKGRAVRWRAIPDVHRYGYVDLGAHLRPNRDVCAFATTYVKSSEKQLSLWVGATGAFKLYFNETMVLEDAAYRHLDADRRAVIVTPRTGYNRITAKVCGDESAPALALRVGAADGGALSIGAGGVEASTAQSAQTEAAAAMKNAAAGAKPSHRAGKGPLDVFESLLAKAGDGASAGLLASFASYLLVTGGDADASHDARDYARRAADKEPTVDRLLLAAKLAEDRNGASALVERAEAIQPRSPREDVLVLLARAQVVRTGPNPRRAFSIYDDVLAIAPHDARATLGKVDLYTDAGLHRTALAVLQRASAAVPHSVALLRGLSGQLRELGREVEAREVESRYAALRFDDGGFLKMQLDLAAARGDAKGTARWARRLLDVEPASVWAHGEIASAELKLGRPSAAVAAYEKALDIAPEDISMLRALSDLHGRLGKRDLQLAGLKKILRIAPQDKSVRTYVEHIDPQGERADEKYAWPPEKFLAKRTVDKSVADGGLRTLHKLGVTTVYDSGLASHFKQVVFQPLSQQAATSSRQYAFVYHADRQVVSLRAARVFRADGRVDEAVESGEAPANDPSINMYTLQRTFVVQFPKLNPGDVVELRYRVDDVSVRNDKSDYFGEVAYLQSTEPVANAEYVLIAPKKKKLTMSIGPAGAPLAKVKKSVSDKGELRISHFVAKDLPALEVEPGMPQLGELLAHVHVSTFASWQEVGAWYWTLSRDKLDVDDDVRKLARELTKGLTTDREKVAAVYQYVANETRYVALEFGIEGIRPRRAALTLARGWGDCKDKATLIVSLLAELGVEAELVILRTGLRGGFDTTTASLEPFDHAIVYVPSIDLYLDGTAEGTGTGELPAFDRSAIGLRISGGQGKLVKLPEPDASTSVDDRVFDVTMQPDGDLSFKGHVEVRGVDAAGSRARYRAEATRRERVSSDLAGALGAVELSPGPKGLTVTGVDGIEAPVRLDVAGAGSASQQGSTWVIGVGPTWNLVGTYASRSQRTHDLLLGPQRVHRERWSVTIPAGMRVASSPKQAKIATKFGSYEQTTKTDGKQVIVESTLRLDRSRISPGEYAAFRAFCQQVDASSGASLLVAKK